MSETGKNGSNRLHEGLVVQGRFRLEAPLGEGGMGVVWSALHLLTQRRVALKFLKTNDVASIRRFLREARIAGTLTHRHIAPVHDVLQLDDGTPVMVMDLLSGEPLSRRLQREGTLSVAALVEIMRPVVAAIGAAHDKGVVHRDLKPENVFLERSGDAPVKVLDFGIAKVVEPAASDGAGLTQSGAVLGTPHYMAPEQVFGDRTIDHRADVWALGVIFHEVLTGRRPFDGENFGQVFKAIALAPIPELASIAPTVPAALAVLVDRMLSRERDARPSLAEVDRVLASCATTASDEPIAAPATRVSLSTLNATSSPPRRSSRASWRSPSTWIALGIGSALGATALGIALTRSASPKAAATNAVPSIAPATSSAPPALIATGEPSIAPAKPAITPTSASASASIEKPIVVAPKPKPPVVSPTPSTSSATSANAKLPGGVHGVSPY
jgi:serine/threonine protein kinase